MSVVTLLVLAFVIALAIGLAISNFKKKDGSEIKDPRQNLEPNDTNYNLNKMDPEVIEGASRQEAQEIIDKAQKSDTPSLSEQDFYALKKKVD